MYGSTIACFQNDINKVSSRPPGSPDTVWNTRLVNCGSRTLYQVIVFKMVMIKTSLQFKNVLILMKYLVAILQ